ncbi:unnamed protein product [marine sediment metagenome]|uniref:Uncharacterized protein n=1 Tax=marine sediment metagenome TaxID=412755 RepID=X0W8Z7_9ZZZZ
MECELKDIDGNLHKGKFIRISLAIWKPKRKAEPTLTLESEDNIINIPCRNIDWVFEAD